MKNLLILLLSFFVTISMGWAVFANAGEVNMNVQYTFNGTEEMEVVGFKLYQTDPIGNDVLVADIIGPDIRAWTGTVDVSEGRSVFYLTSYNTTVESNRSNGVPFEYMEPETGAIPPPTIIIKFN